jgi:porin
MYLRINCRVAVWLLVVAASGRMFGQDEATEETGPELGNHAASAVADCQCMDCQGCQDGCLWTSPTLTGDWLGYRSRLQESGVTFAGRVTQFGFGIDGGINTPLPPMLPLGQGDTFKYTGRGEYDLIFDLEKFGGLPHGSLLVRAEHWYGEFGNVSLSTGALTPAVFPALLPPRPFDPGVPYITNFLVTQPLSEELVLFAGKKDVLGGADQDIFAGGDGTSQFVNQAFIANPAFLLALPYTGFTAGAVMPREWGKVSTFIYDPKNRTADFFNVDDLFAEGIIVGAEVGVDTNFLSLPGEHHVGGIWKHVDMTDLAFAAPPPSEYPEPVVPGFATRPDSYTFYYGFDQFLVQYSDKPQQGWGLFGRASISDGNPTPLRYFLSAGLGGNSPVRTEKGDTFGLGWYYVGATDEFGPAPRQLLDPQDGSGVELFYNFQVTKWMNVTPDVQFVSPGSRAIADDAVIYGLRVNLTL